MPEGDTPTNAWIAKVAADQGAGHLTLELHGGAALAAGIKEADGLVLVDAAGNVMAFARVYRVRSSTERTTLHFDCLVQVFGEKSAASPGLTLPNAAIERLPWSDFVAAYQNATGKSYSDLKPIKGDTREEQDHLRRLLQLSLMDDLLGPANGPREEVIGMSVRDRYLVGKLAPKEFVQEEGRPSLEEKDLGEIPDNELSPKANEEHIANDKKSTYRLSAKGEDEDNETDRLENQSLVPSSIGFTFCLEGSVREIELDVRWGQYIRGESESEKNPITGKPVRAWKRVPSGGITKLPLNEGPIEPLAVDPACPRVVVAGVIRPVSTVTAGVKCSQARRG